MCGGYTSAHLKFNVSVDTIIGMVPKGAHGLVSGFFFPGTGDYYDTEPDDPRVNMVKVKLTEKEPNQGMFSTIEVMPRVEVLVPIETVDINPIEYSSYVWNNPLWPDDPSNGEERRYYKVKTFEEI